MKKAFLLAVALLIVGVASAQKLDFGIKGGFNFANASDITLTPSVQDSYSKTANNVNGWHLGVYTELGISIFSLQPELFYSQKGFKSKNNITGKVGEVKLNYLDIPVLVKFKPIPLLSVFTGPQVSVKLSEKITGTDDFKGALTSANLKGGEWALVAGAGFQFSKLQIQARYNWGLSNISKESAEIDFKNQLFQISLGYKIF